MGNGLDAARTEEAAPPSSGHQEFNTLFSSDVSAGRDGALRDDVSRGGEVVCPSSEGRGAGGAVSAPPTPGYAAAERAPPAPAKSQQEAPAENPDLAEAVQGGARPSGSVLRPVGAAVQTGPVAPVPGLPARPPGSQLGSSSHGLASRRFPPELQSTPPTRGARHAGLADALSGTTATHVAPGTSTPVERETSVAAASEGAGAPLVHQEVSGRAEPAPSVSSTGACTGTARAAGPAVPSQAGTTVPAVSQPASRSDTSARTAVGTGVPVGKPADGEAFPQTLAGAATSVQPVPGREASSRPEGKASSRPEGKLGAVATSRGGDDALCSVHADQRLDGWCSTCRTAVCRTCRRTEHALHEAGDVTTAPDPRRRALAEAEAEVTRWMVKHAALTEDIVTMETAVQQEKKEAVSAIDQKVAQVVAGLQAARERAVAEVEGQASSLQEPLARRRGQLEDWRREAAAALASSREQLQAAHPALLPSLSDVIASRLGALGTSGSQLARGLKGLTPGGHFRPKLDLSGVLDSQATSTPCYVLRRLHGDRFLPEVTAKVAAPGTSSQEPRETTPERNPTAKPHGVSDATVCSASAPNTNVNQFSSLSSRKTSTPEDEDTDVKVAVQCRQIWATNLKTVKTDTEECFVRSLCVDSDNGQVIIGDFNNKKLKRYSSDGTCIHFQHLDGSPCSIALGPSALAVVMEGTLCIQGLSFDPFRREVKIHHVVTANNSYVPTVVAALKDSTFVVGNLEQDRFLHYDSEGNLIKTSTCPVKGPILSIFEDHRKNLVISSRKESAVVIVSPEGDKLKTFQRSLSGNIRWLPTCAITTADDLVVVADYKSNDVVMFAPDGQIVLTIKVSGVEYPRNLAYDGVRDRIFVSNTTGSLACLQLVWQAVEGVAAPSQLAYDPKLDRLYVSSQDGALACLAVRETPGQTPRAGPGSAPGGPGKADAHTELPPTGNADAHAELPPTGNADAHTELPPTGNADAHTELLPTRNADAHAELPPTGKADAHTELPPTGKADAHAELPPTRNADAHAELPPTGKADAHTELPPTGNADAHAECSVTEAKIKVCMEPSAGSSDLWTSNKSDETVENNRVTPIKETGVIKSEIKDQLLPMSGRPFASENSSGKGLTVNTLWSKEIQKTGSEKHRPCPNALAFSSEFQQLIVGDSENQNIKRFAANGSFWTLRNYDCGPICSLSYSASVSAAVMGGCLVLLKSISHFRPMKTVIIPNAEAASGVNAPVIVVLEGETILVTNLSDNAMLYFNFDGEIIRSAPCPVRAPVSFLFEDHGGQLLVSSLGEGAVVLVSEGGERLQEFGGLTPGAAVRDRWGRVLATDTAAGQLVVFSPEGALLARRAVEGVAAPSQLAYDSKLDRLYVSSQDGALACLAVRETPGQTPRAGPGSAPGGPGKADAHTELPPTGNADAHAELPPTGNADAHTELPPTGNADAHTELPPTGNADPTEEARNSGRKTSEVFVSDQKTQYCGDRTDDNAVSISNLENEPLSSFWDRDLHLSGSETSDFDVCSLTGGSSHCSEKSTTLAPVVTVTSAADAASWDLLNPAGSILGLASDQRGEMTQEDYLNGSSKFIRNVPVESGEVSAHNEYLACGPEIHAVLAADVETSAKENNQSHSAERSLTLRYGSSLRNDAAVGDSRSSVHHSSDKTADETCKTDNVFQYKAQYVVQWVQTVTKTKSESSEPTICAISCNAHTQRIVLVDKANAAIRQYGQTGEFKNLRRLEGEAPTSLCSGSTLDAAVTSGRLCLLETGTYTQKKAAAIAGSLGTSASTAPLVAALSQASFAVARLAEDRLRCYSQAGKVTHEAHCPARLPLASLAADKDGHLLLASPGSRSLLLAQVGRDRVQTLREIPMACPRAAVIDEHGFIIAIDGDDDKLVVFDPSDRPVLRSKMTKVGTPAFLAYNADGDAVIVASESGMFASLKFTYTLKEGVKKVDTVENRPVGLPVPVDVSYLLSSTAESASSSDTAPQGSRPVPDPLKPALARDQSSEASSASTESCSPSFGRPWPPASLGRTSGGATNSVGSKPSPSQIKLKVRWVKKVTPVGSEKEDPVLCALAFNSSSRQIIASDEANQTIKRYSADGKFLVLRRLEKSAPTSIACSPTAAMAVTSGSLCVLETGTYTEKKVLQGAGSAGEEASAAPLVAALSDGTFALCRLPGNKIRFLEPGGHVTRSLQCPVRGPLTSVAADGEGNLLVASSGSGSVALVPPSGGRALRAVPLADPRDAAIDKHGFILAIDGADGSLAVYDPEDRLALRQALAGLPSPALLAYDCGKDQLYVASESGSLACLALTYAAASARDRSNPAEADRASRRPSTTSSDSPLPKAACSTACAVASLSAGGQAPTESKTTVLAEIPNADGVVRVTLLWEAKLKQQAGDEREPKVEHLALNPLNQRLLVADGANQKIKVHGPDGRFVVSRKLDFGPPCSLACSGSVTAAVAASHLYVLETGSLAVKRRTPIPGCRAESGPAAPVVAALADGSFVVANADGNKLLHFSQDGELADWCQSSARGPLTSLAEDPDGNLLVSSAGSSTVVLLSKSGSKLREFQCQTPTSCIKTKHGLVLVVNGQMALLVFDPEGKALHLNGLKETPRHLAYDSQTDRVYASTTDGVLMCLEFHESSVEDNEMPTKYFLPEPLPVWPAGLQSGESGALGGQVRPSYSSVVKAGCAAKDRPGALSLRAGGQLAGKTLWLSQARLTSDPAQPDISALALGTLPACQWLCDVSNKRLKQFSPEGQFQASQRADPPPTSLVLPGDMAAAVAGGKLCLLDPATYSPRVKTPIPGCLATEGSLSPVVSAFSDGILVVGNVADDALLLYGSSGSHLATLPNAASGPLVALAPTPMGTVLACCWGAGCVVEVSMGGEHIASYPPPSWAGDLWLPTAAVRLERGAVVVAARDCRDLAVYPGPDAPPHRLPVRGLDDPCHLALHPGSDRLYVASRSGALACLLLGQL